MSFEKKFSKELASGLRKETAEKLREARKSVGSFKEVKGQKIEYKEWLREMIEEARRDVLGKIFRTEDYKRRIKEIDSILGEYKKSRIESVKSDYQEKFNDILENSSLTEEERKELLSTESMEKMSLDDYLVLLKRLSGEGFYHVTRYGLRENVFMDGGGGHMAGEGEFLDSFTPLLEDGMIKDAATTCLNSVEGIESRFCGDEWEDFMRKRVKEGMKIEDVVNRLIYSLKGDVFLDRQSTHFSYGEDKHNMYGSEKDYKFYFYYPVEYILENDYYHSTREIQITVGAGYPHNRQGINQRYNDFEIFNFGEGVPINAGVLCITGDAYVDPETGSQYVLENGQPMKDENGDYVKPKIVITSKEYWEKYFDEHPEIKPNKIIYGNFSPYASNVDQELIKRAEEKEIYNQDDETMKKFKEYEKEHEDYLRGVLTKIVGNWYKKISNKEQLVT